MIGVILGMMWLYIQVLNSIYCFIFDNGENASKTGYQSDGYVKVVDSSSDENASKVQTLYGIEGIEFSDGYLGFKKVETFIDLDGDGKPDVGGKKGTSGVIKLKAPKWMKNLRE